MQLRLQNFSALVQSMAASVQASSARLVDLSVGSVLRAVLEANAGVALWMQHLVLRVLQATRAATSAGGDLDSWMADFSLARLPAVAAAGEVTFSRVIAGLGAAVPVGTLVRTADGARGFAVSADTGHPAFNPVTQAYILAADVLALGVPVRAEQAGAGGNVLAGTITQMASPVPGVDAVTNPADLAGGLDAETDAAFRARFQDYLDTRSRATTRAVGYAIAQVQQGLSYVIAENVDATGAARMGHFTVTVDDGSGTPSAPLLAAVTAAVEAVRPIGSGFTLRPPVVVPVSVATMLAIAPDAVPATVIAAVRDAIAAHVNALPVGAPLPLSRIAQLAHDADRAVWGVAAIALNGSAADITPARHEVLKTATVTVA